MIGEIGILLKEGVQVVGFKDWEIELRLSKATHGNWTEQQSRGCKVTAESFWLSELPDGEFIGLFYKLMQGKLILANEHRIHLTLKGYPLNREIKRLLEMQWID